MIKIDSHHHFWRYKPDEYPWISDSMSNIRRDFLPKDLLPEMKAAGVSGVISVQARQSLAETWDLLRHAEAHDFIHGVVGWVPLISPDFNRILPTVAGHPKLRGVRHILHDEIDPDYMLRDDFNRGVSGLKPFGLPYDILIFERHLPQTLRFVDRHPNQIFIVDHLAKPRVKDNEMSPWRENLIELARRPNVYCKVSGLATEAGYSSWTKEQLRPYIDVVLGAFKPRRVMFGSDWPVCLVAISYLRWSEVVAEALSGLSADEQERVWSGTAREAYRLS